MTPTATPPSQPDRAQVQDLLPPAVRANLVEAIVDHVIDTNEGRAFLEKVLHEGYAGWNHASDAMVLAKVGNAYEDVSELWPGCSKSECESRLRGLAEAMRNPEAKKALLEAICSDYLVEDVMLWDSLSGWCLARRLPPPFTEEELEAAYQMQQGDPQQDSPAERPRG